MKFWLDQVLPDNLVKKEFQQSFIAGLWAVCSLWVLVSRASSPPTVTRWTIDGRYGRKTWNGLKVAFSYAFLALIVVVVSVEVDAKKKAFLKNQEGPFF